MYSKKVALYILISSVLFIGCTKKPDTVAVQAQDPASHSENNPALAAAQNALTALEREELKSISTNPNTEAEDVILATRYYSSSSDYILEDIRAFIKKNNNQALLENLNIKKIAFIKKVYADAINEDLMAVDIIKLHASREIRQLIEKRDLIAENNEGEMCDWVRNVLIPGQDYDVKANQIKYTTRDNGRIRVEAKNFGEKFTIDFSVQCDADRCKITDIYDPESYKNELKSIVQQGTC